jgi:hypothetical protein
LDRGRHRRESIAWHTRCITRSTERIANNKDLKTKGCRMKFGQTMSRNVLFVMLTGGALALGGCSSAPPLFSADGRPTQQINCPANGGWRNCTDNAKALCPSGYDVIDQSTGDSSNSLLVACRAGASQ